MLCMKFSDEFESALNRIGVEALAVAGNEDARVLIYAEVCEELEHVIFRHGEPGGTKLYCADDYPAVLDALRDAWEISRAMGAKYTWRAMVYRVEQGRMDVDLKYKGEIDENLSMYDKEDRLLEEYYPGVEVVPMPEDPPGSFQPEPSSKPLWRFWR